MPDALISKLEHFTRLSADDRTGLREAVGASIRHVAPREDIAEQGEPSRGVSVILSGWACRYKQLEDGRRQITAYLVPGDLCGLDVHLLARMDHAIGALSPVSFGHMSRDAVQGLMERHPRLSKALSWSELVASAIDREWIVNLGRRDAVERMGHLFCELFVRLRAVDLTDGDSCELPVTQAELGDTTGLSAVHVNRTIQELRGRGLIQLKGKRLTIPDLERLQLVSLFDEGYLHLGREGREHDANDG